MKSGLKKLLQLYPNMTIMMCPHLAKVCIRAVDKLRHRGQMRVGGRGHHRFVVLDESKFSHKRKLQKNTHTRTHTHTHIWNVIYKHMICEMSFAA